MILVDCRILRIYRKIKSKLKIHTSPRFLNVIFQPCDLQLLLGEWQFPLLLSKWYCHARGWGCLLPLGASVKVHRGKDNPPWGPVPPHQLVAQDVPAIVHTLAKERKSAWFGPKPSSLPTKQFKHPIFQENTFYFLSFTAEEIEMSERLFCPKSGGLLNRTRIWLKSRITSKSVDFLYITASLKTEAVWLTFVHRVYACLCFNLHREFQITVAVPRMHDQSPLICVKWQSILLTTPRRVVGCGHHSCLLPFPPRWQLWNTSHLSSMMWKQSLMRSYSGENLWCTFLGSVIKPGTQRQRRAPVGDSRRARHLMLV